MTLQAIGGLVPYPPLFWSGGANAFGPGVTTMAFDSTTDRVAFLFRAPATGSITKFSFRTGTVTSGPTLDCRIESVSNGRPSGTLFGTNTNASVAVAGANTWQTATLTSAASVNQGDELALVLVYSSGTANFQLAVGPAGVTTQTGQYPIQLQDTGGGTWAQPTTTNAPFEWIVEYSGTGPVWVPGLLPLDGASTTTSFNSGTSPNERALKFTLPFKASIKSMRALMMNIAAGGDFTYTLWPASSTTDADALAQVTEDGDFALSTTIDGYVELGFPSEQTLSANTVYYLGVRPGTANSVGLNEMSVPAGIANAMNAFPIPSGGGFLLATRVWTAGSAGAWTTTATTLPIIHAMLSKLDDGAGGGGVAKMAGEGGGFAG